MTIAFALSALCAAYVIARGGYDLLRLRASTDTTYASLVVAFALCLAFFVIGMGILVIGAL